MKRLDDSKASAPEEGKIDIWMSWYIGDYRRDTGRLNTVEHGAYRLLIDEYFVGGGPLPDDDKILRRIVCADTLEEWQAIRPAVERFFRVEDGKWHHKRVEKELDAARKRAAKARAAAEARWAGADPIAGDWQPSELNAAYAAKLGLDVAATVENFIGHNIANGSRSKDWQKMWRGWCSSAAKRRAEA
jgi:uncharacterized protein YdaU (DUF1376 family)